MRRCFNLITMTQGSGRHFLSRVTGDVLSLYIEHVARKIVRDNFKIEYIRQRVACPQGVRATIYTYSLSRVSSISRGLLASGIKNGSLQGISRLIELTLATFKFENMKALGVNNCAEPLFSHTPVELTFNSCDKHHNHLPSSCLGSCLHLIQLLDQYSM